MPILVWREKNSFVTGRLWQYEMIVCWLITRGPRISPPESFFADQFASRLEEDINVSFQIKSILHFSLSKYKMLLILP